MTSAFYDEVARLAEDETPSAVVTALRPERMLGARVLAVGGALQGSFADESLDREALHWAQRLVREGQSHAVTVQNRAGEDVELFFDVYPAPATLYIFGGVHVAVPLAKFAKILGFRVSVIDPRGVFATRERFADADELAIEHPDDYLARARFNENSSIVVLTHEPRYDEPILQSALDTAAGYVGAIGSRATNRARVDRLRARGVSDNKLARIHSPIGLDIGSQAPEEIALAIIAEIVASRYGKAGTSLREKAGAFAAA